MAKNGVNQGLERVAYEKYNYYKNFYEVQCHGHLWPVNEDLISAIMAGNGESIENAELTEHVKDYMYALMIGLGHEEYIPRLKCEIGMAMGIAAHEELFDTVSMLVPRAFSLDTMSELVAFIFALQGAIEIGSIEILQFLLACRKDLRIFALNYAVKNRNFEIFDYLSSIILFSIENRNASYFIGRFDLTLQLAVNNADSKIVDVLLERFERYIDIAVKEKVLHSPRVYAPYQATLNAASGECKEREQEPPIKNWCKTKLS